MKNITNREIKFRAWDKEENEMVYDIQQSGYDFQWHIDSPWYEIMQYTGLKDKNGKEIYEGDILKNGNSIQTVSSTMEWNCGCCNGVYGWNFYRDGVEVWEIIGNIYENPNLIK